jgi:hypothetical protein
VIPKSISTGFLRQAGNIGLDNRHPLLREFWTPTNLDADTLEDWYKNEDQPRGNLQATSNLEVTQATGV